MVTLNVTLVIKYGKWQVKTTRLIFISNINYKYIKFKSSKTWLDVSALKDSVHELGTSCFYSL